MENHFERMVHDNVHKLGGAGVVGFKLMYDHIPDQLREQFANWAACNGVVILHLIREAVVQSFFSQQARVVDTLALKGKYFSHSTDPMVQSKMASNKAGLVLDPAEASAYVRDIEHNRIQYRALLKWYKHCSIPYLEVSYEQLISRSSQAYLRIILSFFDVDMPVLRVRHDSKKEKLQQIHPGSCADKIANWQEVAAALAGTETLDACERWQIAGGGFDAVPERTGAELTSEAAIGGFMENASTITALKVQLELVRKAQVEMELHAQQTEAPVVKGGLLSGGNEKEAKVPVEAIRGAA
jgi:hypothetical protein